VSDWSDLIDNVCEDLMDNVPALAVEAANVHRYASWSPEELLSDGKRHMAVWPLGEAERATPLTLGAHELDQLYRVLVWEDAADESSRGVTDQDATAALLDLHNDIRDRFYVQANQGRAGAFRVWYRGARFPDRASRVRWFEVEVSVATGSAFT